MATTTPAEAHRQRILAAKSQGKTTAEANPNANAYELKLMELDNDRRALKQIQSQELKIVKKAELLPSYDGWVKGVLEGNKGVQDDVLMTMLVWNIDTRRYTEALEIAKYALEHKLQLPDQFERTLACLIAEEIAEGQLKGYTPGTLIDVDALIECATLTEAEDMPDQVRAKLHKAIGYGLTDEDDETALTHLQRALTLHDKSGVKKDIEQLERKLKKKADLANGNSA